MTVDVVRESLVNTHWLSQSNGWWYWSIPTLQAAPTLMIRNQWPWFDKFLSSALSLSFKVCLQNKPQTLTSCDTSRSSFECEFAIENLLWSFARAKHEACAISTPSWSIFCSHVLVPTFGSVICRASAPCVETSWLRSAVGAVDDAYTWNPVTVSLPANDWAKTACDTENESESPSVSENDVSKSSANSCISCLSDLSGDIFAPVLSFSTASGALQGLLKAQKLVNLAPLSIPLHTRGPGQPRRSWRSRTWRSESGFKVAEL